jgi:hypothetical protein
MSKGSGGAKGILGAADVVAAFRALEFPWGQLPDRLMEVIHEENVDEVIDSLPSDIQQYFVSWAKRFYVDRDGSGILADGEPDHVPARALRAVQGWLERNQTSD